MSSVAQKLDSFYILGSRVDLVQIPETIARMEKWIGEKGSTRNIVLSNANNISLGARDSSVRATTNSSDLSIADGISLVWASRLYGHRLKKRVYGPDLLSEFLRVSEKKGYSNFFYGSTFDNLNLLIRRLKERFPDLKISGSYSPAFKENIEEEESVIDLINSSGSDVLWVGLGGPKQDLWMHRHKLKVKVPVMVGVGAAFEFLSGRKRQAPRWVGDYGFEWLFRLASEPKRLWRRYLINNFLFVYYLVLELFSRIYKNYK